VIKYLECPNDSLLFLSNIERLRHQRRADAGKTFFDGICQETLKQAVETICSRINVTLMSSQRCVTQLKQLLWARA